MTAALGVVLASMTPGCAIQGEPAGEPVRETVRPERPQTPGISGKPPTPAGKPGQSLPLEPARTVAFETDEGTSLSLDVAPDGRSVVFDMLGDIYALPIDGGEAERLTAGMALDTQPVFSPDGETILFLSDRSGAENLWLMDRDGTQLRQLSFHDDNPVWVSPEWSPDGETIIVSRFWQDRNAYELWQFKARPGAMGKVLRASTPATDEGAPVSSLGAHFNPDGQTLYMASLVTEAPDFGDLSPWTVIAYNPASGETRHIAGDEMRPVFRPRISPDGTRLAYAERRGNETWLRLRDLESGETRTLGELDPDSLQASLRHDAVPRFDFTPDGAALIVNSGGKIRRVPVSRGEAVDIPFTADVEQPLGPLVRTQIPLESGPVRARLLMSPAWSPDGKTLAFSALGNVHTQRLGTSAEPKRLIDSMASTYHPAWSPDGAHIALVSWTGETGGHVWTASRDGDDIQRISDEAAFYSHPVFTPDGSAIIAVRSEAQTRNETYMEYGQLRAADLVYLPLDGAPARTIMTGRIGGTPHFGPTAGEVLINTGRGVEAVSIDSGKARLVTQAEGPNWYFAEGPAAADDLRVSPDGRHAMAQIAHQLHLYRLPEAEGGTVNLSAPATPHTRLTDIGADYFAWSADGRAVLWSVGSTVYRLPLKAAGLEAKDGERPVPIEQTYGSRHDIILTAPRERPGRSVLLEGADVIPMTDRVRPERTIQEADILVRDGKIAAIGPSSSLDVPDGVARLDLSGHYIIPGLIDAHYHVADIRREVLQFDSWGLKANLAYGITTLFDPSTLSIDMLTYQDLLAAGNIKGPRLYSTGTAIFDFNDFRSKAEVDAVLKRYRDHYRLRNLKQYRSGNRRVRQWFAQSASELGMTPTTEGALSFKLGLSQILDGYSGNEHALPPPVLHDDVTELFARSRTSSTLTLMITHGGIPAEQSFIPRRADATGEKYARFAPGWFMEREFEGAVTRPETDFLYRTIAASAHRIFMAGGIVGVGAHGDIPGLGTLWEIQAYAEGGWSPAEALWAATMGSAKTIARDESLGSLATGKAADLVILEDNPLSDITALERARYVMKRGHLYKASTLEELPLTQAR